MIVKWLNKALSLFWSKDDRFLVVEILEDQNRAASIKANFLSKEIKVLKVVSKPDLKKLLNKFRRLSRYKIILGLDSHLATTIYSSVVLVRDNYKELIDEPELDNLISQAIWKFFDRQRSKVASKMGVTDLDILLADVKIRGIKLDGHKVVNPIGFKAKTAEVQFSQTFLLRSFMDSLKDILPIRQVVFMTENGAAWSNVVAKASSENNFLMANLFGAKTLLFLAEGSQNSYWDRFNWGEENLNRSLAADLAVDSAVAKLIIDRYVKNETSLTFKKRLEHLILKELQMLANGLNSAMRRAEARFVYVHPFFGLPSVFAKIFKIQPVALDLISQKFGFDIKFKNNADSKNAFSFLAELVEWYLSPQDDKMSQLAKRRVRWLSPLS